MTVSSLEISTLPAVPRMLVSESSSVTPIYSETTVEPVKTAISLRMAFLLSPKEGAFMAQTWTPAWSLLTIRLVRGSLSTSSAMMMSGLFFSTAYSRYLRICLKEVILCSEMRMRGFSNSTFWFFWLLMKQGEMYPLSNFIPSTNSIQCLRVLLWPMEITPDRPTFSIRSARSPPISSSPLAEIVATLLIWDLVSIGMAIFLSSATMVQTARSMPFFISLRWMPVSTFLRASLKMERARMVAVVVPSPASSLALLATDLTRLAPMLANLSSNSMALATVTPSFVIFTPPQVWSMRTFLPLGPRVTWTALASASQPSSILARALLPKSTSLAANPNLTCWVMDLATG